MTYLGLQKGKVFSVCMIHVWVTICLKLEKTVHLLSDIHMMFFTVVSEMSRAAYSAGPKA